MIGFGHMKHPRRFAQFLYRDPALTVLVLVIGVLFFLQARFLGQVAFTVSDEGVHALVGKLMFEGQQPYRDYYYSHPLLMSFFLGLSQQFSPSLWFPRLVYLALNLTCAIPLFLFLRRLNGNALAALVASLFYVTYFLMVDNDFRFIGLRQVANVFLIWFLFVSTMPVHTSRTLAAQIILAIGNVLVMFQAAANLALVSLAVVLSAPRKKRFVVFRQFCIIGAATVAALLLFLVLFPGSVELTLLEHASRPLVERWGRITWTLGSKHDLFFYGMSMISLVLGALFQRGVRLYCLAALGMIALVFVPRAFFPHYFVIAAPAFAIGIFSGVSLIMSLFRKRLRHIGTFAALAVLAIHWTIVLPPLLRNWNGHGNPEYYQTIGTLKTMPEPLLTFFEPVYAVESGLRTVHAFKLSDFRTFGSLLGDRLSDEDYDQLSAQACTIFLVPWDTGYIPSHILEQWVQDYERVQMAGDVLLLKTNNPGCDQ